MFVVSDEDEKVVWKCYHERLSKAGFAWDRNSLSQTKTLGDLSPFIDKNWVKQNGIFGSMKFNELCEKQCSQQGVE